MTGAVVVLVCAMRKKLARKPMRALVAHLRSHPSLRVIELDEVGMGADVERWPAAHVLLTLVSGGFPLDQCARYAEARRPVVVNDLAQALTLRSRIATRRALAAHGVPLAHGVVYDAAAGDRRVLRAGRIYVYTRTGICRGSVAPPYVEKPADADNHEVHIHYGASRCARRLHRKVGDRASEALPFGAPPARPAGSYVYEQFHAPAMCADVKVYAAGDYFYAEARKAPHIDGKVERDEAGLEVRTRVALTRAELAICDRVVSAFGQFMNGFDLLRTKCGQTFVIDVNGWSFVKRSNEWAPTSADKLISFILQTAPRATARRVRHLELQIDSEPPAHAHATSAA